MSYNITSWKIRRIHLELPLTFNFRAWLKEHPAGPGVRWCLEDNESACLCNLGENTWKLVASGHALSGIIEGDKLILNDPKSLNWRGDCSGHLYSDVLLPLFQSFKGDIDALVVWESGDSINHLNIVQGVVSDEEIE